MSCVATRCSDLNSRVFTASHPSFPIWCGEKSGYFVRQFIRFPGSSHLTLAHDISRTWENQNNFRQTAQKNSCVHQRTLAGPQQGECGRGRHGRETLRLKHVLSPHAPLALALPSHRRFVLVSHNAFSDHARATQTVSVSASASGCRRHR